MDVLKENKVKIGILKKSLELDIIITTRTLHLGKTHSTPHEGFIFVGMNLPNNYAPEFLQYQVQY